jgi:hypothetical protein
MTRGLPVKGYKPTQSPEAIEAVNRLKVHEERFLRELDAIDDAPLSKDGRALALARTNLQQATMWAARAVFQPERLDDEDMP